MINVKPVVKKIFEMSGILKLIPIEDTENIGGNNSGKCI